jgi:uncharacterized membrane protein
MAPNQEENKTQTNLKSDSNASRETSEVGNAKTSSGLEENLAGLLCYLAGFITGIIFIILEKENRFVRFHALQSIFISVVMVILSFIFTSIPIIGWLIGLLISPLSIVLWILLMYKAYQGQWFKLPILGEMAEKQLNNMK